MKLALFAIVPALALPIKMTLPRSKAVVSGRDIDLDLEGAIGHLVGAGGVEIGRDDGRGENEPAEIHGIAGGGKIASVVDCPPGEDNNSGANEKGDTDENENDDNTEGSGSSEGGSPENGNSEGTEGSEGNGENDENGPDENGSDENGSDENGSDENGSDENGSAESAAGNGSAESAADKNMGESAADENIGEGAAANMGESAAAEVQEVGARNFATKKRRAAPGAEALLDRWIRHRKRIDEADILSITTIPSTATSTASTVTSTITVTAGG